MPETAVHEDCHLRPWKDEVRDEPITSPGALLNAVSESTSVQKPTEPHLRGGVGAPNLS